MKPNWEEVVQLINVLDGTRQLPKLRALHDTAMARLEEISAKAEEPADQRVQDKYKAPPKFEPALRDEPKTQDHQAETIQHRV